MQIQPGHMTYYDICLDSSTLALLYPHMKPTAFDWIRTSGLVAPNTKLLTLQLLKWYF